MSECDFPTPRAYALDPVAGDTTAPEQPKVVVKVREPQSRQTVGCSISGCGDYGTIVLTATANDDRAVPNALGYRLAVVGEPGNLKLALDPEKTVVPVDGQFVLPFKGTDAFEVTLEVRAVDPSGNVGQATRLTVGVPASFPWTLALGIGIPVLAVLALGALLRRRRRT